LERSSQLAVFVSSDSTKLVATAYVAAFSTAPAYLSDGSTLNSSIVNSVSLVQPLSITVSSITANVLVQPLGS
jgi:hypothetical protein